MNKLEYIDEVTKGSIEYVIQFEETAIYEIICRVGSECEVSILLNNFVDTHKINGYSSYNGYKNSS